MIWFFAKYLPPLLLQMQHFSFRNYISVFKRKFGGLFISSSRLDKQAADYLSVTVRFQPLASAPILKNRVFKISASQKFETVVNFLRKKLNCKDTDSVICYVNSVFAPRLDEGVGGLWRVSTGHSFYLEGRIHV
jgi:hypothetical protein